MLNLFYRRISPLVRPFLITLFIVGVLLLGANKLLTATDDRIECPYERCPRVPPPECPGHPDPTPCPEVYEDPCPKQKDNQ